ncbi:MAG: hypothetical protein DBY25_08475 [Clostridiales bacterium]|nr:MAG: hypothetical protein DBY25_08475 [Clostridiales bacterium]
MSFPSVKRTQRWSKLNNPASWGNPHFFQHAVSLNLPHRF